VQTSEIGAERARDRARYRLVKIAENMLRERLLAAHDTVAEAAITSIAERALDPYSAAARLFGDGRGNA